MISIKHPFQDIAKSKFVRSVFLRILAIFLFLGIAMVSITIFSFTSEVSKNTIADKQHQLELIEKTISDRTDEISSIAYSVGTDSNFYLEPVEDTRSSGYEMSNTLSRYLVGNSFIENLAYYRVAEPNKIYVSSGERDFTEFFTAEMGTSQKTAEYIIKQIQGLQTTSLRILEFDKVDKSYITYTYPLPEFSKSPKAFVLVMIPMSEVTPLLDSQLADTSGSIAIFDSSGSEIYQYTTLDKKLPLKKYVSSNYSNEEKVKIDGTKYILQKTVSDSNSWTYISMIKESDTIVGLAGKQLVIIILLLFLMIAAVVAMFICIVVQYKPIRNLAVTMSDSPDDSESRETGQSLIDESTLIANTFETLKSDSKEKEKFELAYMEANAANKAKSAFLSSMSHDIRTPMNAIIGMNSIAYKYADDPDYVRECLKKSQTASQYLLDIINDVLDMSRIESGKFSLTEEAVNLRTLEESLVSIIQPSIDEKKLELVIETDKIQNNLIIGDHMRLTQIFINILSNAVKFTPEGGKITVVMEQAKGSDNSEYGDYRFSISDTGIGMSPEFVEHVFDTFTRATDTHVSNTEGTGLGMAIAKNLVEMMGGSIQCESELNKGTTFTVKLHMKLAYDNEWETASKDYLSRQTLVINSPDEIINLSDKTILLAEDNIFNREIAHKIIGETKAQILDAGDGKSAYELFMKKPDGYFDLILMDIQMPIMNGYDATKKIRACGRSDAGTIPIFAMTASTFDEDIILEKQSGMSGHIAKPYTPANLYDVFKKIFS